RGYRARVLARDDRGPHRIAPFRPGAVVVAHVVQPQQVGEHEPRVARALADAAVGDDLAVVAPTRLLDSAVDLLEFCPRAEAAVGGRGLRPRDRYGAGDVPAAEHALLRVLGHVGALAGVFVGRAHVDERPGAEEVEHMALVGADGRIVPLDDRVIGARHVRYVEGGLAVLGEPGVA